MGMLSNLGKRMGSYWIRQRAYQKYNWIFILKFFTWKKLFLWKSNGRST